MIYFIMNIEWVCNVDFIYTQQELKGNHLKSSSSNNVSSSLKYRHEMQTRILSFQVKCIVITFAQAGLTAEMINTSVASE